ncbi:class II aldolase/adducin family protein [Mesorhizobium sp. YC-39]|uniref:class II aldolase/adducin family protein n=1 Tax=unclassified Mesorhizobium TaxID=325217 RepID=UPI0021E8C727|nr:MULTISPECIES: class II aldolase/adducin family protein [unclassified Mesorhizobium]MCV3211149.1 class II aldolase/adducin family protein [Mesorhizobium sp. YC-2]MCV3232874.1 class II aldolase/adducin family protein [Mesorhizobium sp. YC-39]
MTMTVENPRQSLVTAALDAEAQRLNIGTTGNISARLNGGMLITPSGIPPKKLKPELIVAMDLDGAWSGDIKPSTEWALHAAIYKSRPEVSAVMHAHPDHCVALSCARENLPAFHYMVAGFGGDDVRCSKYASFGSPELAKFAVEALENRTACLLANHGMVAIGTSVAEAFNRTVKLETMVRQFLLCRSFSAPVLLTVNEMTEVEQRYRAGYARQAAPVA